MSAAIDPAEVQKEVIELIRKESKTDKIDLENTLDELGVDSLGQVKLALDIEERFYIDLENIFEDPDKDNGQGFVLRDYEHGGTRAIRVKHVVNYVVAELAKPKEERSKQYAPIS